MANTTKKEYTGMENMEEKETVKEPVNILDLLLGSDVGEIKLPTKQVEITRLTEVYGTPFIITCKALTPDRYEEVQDMALEVKGKEVDLDVNLLQLFVTLEGVMDDTGKSMFKNKDLMSKFKAQTPKELVRKILLSGEITSVYSEIAKLSGFGDDAVKAVKN
jgi:Phage XkdN-like protein.